MNKSDYYREGLSESFDEHGITATPQQLAAVAEDIAGYAENESQAFYSPGWGDRMAEIEGEWKRKYSALQAEFEKYQTNAETAVKIALRQNSDEHVSIGEHGEVLRHGGRTVQIQ